jgi:8-amino-7-oxononanoate synthase
VAHAGVSHASVVAVSSLAKAFGAPVACVAGPARIVGRLRTAGSALYSSPPSQVDIAAATRAVDRNAVDGDRLRSALARRVRTLRRVAARQNLTLVGGLFPVQSTPVIATGAGRWLLDRLAAEGVRAVLRQTCRGGSAVTLVVTAAHPVAEIERAAQILGHCWHDLQEVHRVG